MLTGRISIVYSFLVWALISLVISCSEDPSRPNDVRDRSGTATCDSQFTACVHRCGETDSRERVAAACNGGVFHCDNGLIPAVACPASDWTAVGAGCGPWVDGYDCAGCGVCTDRGLLDCVPC